QGIRVLGIEQLDEAALAFVDDYCERELDPLLTPVTVDPSHPFPRVINKALCVGLLLRRRRRSSLTYTGVVTVPRALPRLVRLPSQGTIDFIFLADLVVHHAVRMYQGYDIVSSAAFWNRCARNCTTGARATRCGWRSSPRLTPRSSSAWARYSNLSPGRFSQSTVR